MAALCPFAIFGDAKDGLPGKTASFFLLLPPGKKWPRRSANGAKKEKSRNFRSGFGPFRDYPYFAVLPLPAGLAMTEPQPL
jgi:hypothetical protein